MHIDATGLLDTAQFIASPNCDERPQGTDINLLVIHNISLPPDEFGSDGVIDLFTNRIDPQAHPYYQSLQGLKVSAHFFIRRDGNLIQFVPCHQRAWHAGVSRFAGRELGDLGEEELVVLHAECARDDEEAARLVEAFLDRGPYAATWRTRRRASTDGPMTGEEARRILGVGPDDGPDAIREAHRRLMMANHPDHGGSAYLASKINQARDVLLRA